MFPTNGALDQLQKRLGTTWSHLMDAHQRAAETKSRLRAELAPFDSTDTTVIVSGSLARNEFTRGSDIDWTLLIDGVSDPGHYEVMRRISSVVDSFDHKKTGVEGTFGGMVFSHDLIHDIGGENDTNRNITRRLLLLLECAPIGHDEAFRRVRRNLLSRYLLEDRGFWAGAEFRVPRFLQNDFARYWRTIAVDFAYKLRSRSSRGWAIRNLKLRMSRKLIYVSGLLACFGCHFEYSEDRWRGLSESRDGKDELIRYFEEIFSQTPLDLLSGFLLRHQHLNQVAIDIIGSYNEFMGILADPKKRQYLEELSEDDAAEDELFQYARFLSHRFRDGLLDLFFDTQSGVDRLTRNYGVF